MGGDHAQPYFFNCMLGNIGANDTRILILVSTTISNTSFEGMHPATPYTDVKFDSRPKREHLQNSLSKGTPSFRFSSSSSHKPSIMSSSRQSVLQLYHAFTSLGRRWPADPLRPTVSFGATLRAAAHRAFLVSPPSVSQIAPPGQKQPTTASIAEALQTVDDAKLVEGGESALKSLSQEEIAYAHKSLKSLEGLLSGQASQQVSSKMRRRTSNTQLTDQLLSHSIQHQTLFSTQRQGPSTTTIFSPPSNQPPAVRASLHHWENA